MITVKRNFVIIQGIEIQARPLVPIFEDGRFNSKVKENHFLNLNGIQLIKFQLSIDAYSFQSFCTFQRIFVGRGKKKFLQR